MEYLPVPTRELILDRLTHQQVIRLCQVSSIYQRICDNYWPGRASRLLDPIPNVATPGTGATNLTPYQQYLELWKLCAPKAKDKPLTAACAREVGKRANRTEIQEYLRRGGNPQDVAYGLASVDADQLVQEMIERYPEFAHGMARNIIRGWGNGGQVEQFSSSFRGGWFGDVSIGDGRYLLLDGSLDSGDPNIMWNVARLIYPRPSAAAEYLASRGFPEVPVSRGVTPTLGRVLERAIDTRDLNYIRDRFNTGDEYFRHVIHPLLIRQGSPALFEELFRMDLPLDTSIILTGLLQQRPEIFLLVSRWLQANRPLSPELLNKLKDKALNSGDWELVRWATGLEPGDSGI